MKVLGTLALAFAIIATASVGSAMEQNQQKPFCIKRFMKERQTVHQDHTNVYANMQKNSDAIYNHFMGVGRTR